MFRIKPPNNELNTRTFQVHHGTAIIIFDWVQWTLTTGAVYYIVGKYDKNLAKLISIFLLSGITVPSLSYILYSIADMLGLKSRSKLHTLFYFLLCLPINAVLAFYIIKVVEFIAENQNGS